MSEEMIFKRPSGWAVCSLGDVRVDRGDRVTPAEHPGETFELFSIPSFPSGRADVTQGLAIGSDKQSVESGTVLVSKINPRINRVWVVRPRTRHRAIASTEWIPFFPLDGLEPDFLAYYLRRDEFREFLAMNVSGVGGSLMRVRPAVLDRYPLVLPPREEQRRIVAALEEHLSELDAAVAGLERARANARRLRQSVRDATLSAFPTRRIGELLADPLSNGRSVPTAEEGFPVLRLTCLRSGMIDQGEFKIGAWSPDAARPFLIREGDFLVSRGNGSRTLVGRGGLVGHVTRDVAYPDTLIRVRPKPTVLSAAFLRIAWDSSTVRRQIEAVARTTAGIYKINQQDIEQLAIPVPPTVEEQELVAAVVDDQLIAIDRCEQEIDTQLLRATRLRQSILKHAFEGKLVPQDPNDEPASVLMDRIRAERESAAPRAPKSRPKAKTSRKASRR